MSSFPREAVRLFELARDGQVAQARDLCRWFMPLLHLDVHKKLVRCIKLASQLTGSGVERVRLRRPPLEGGERARIGAVARQALATRPAVA